MQYVYTVKSALLFDFNKENSIFHAVQVSS